MRPLSLKLPITLPVATNSKLDLPNSKAEARGPQRQQPSASSDRRSDYTKRHEAPSSSHVAASSKPSTSKLSQVDDEPDYETLYISTTKKAAPKTAEEILEEKRLARAAILAKYRSEKEGSLSQPEDQIAPRPLISSTPGTPAAVSSGIISAVAKLNVEGTVSPKSTTSRADTPARRGTHDIDSDDEDEGGRRAAAEQRKRDEEDLKNLEMQARAEASGPPKESTQGRPEEDVSAADYDPEDETMFDDRKERERLFMNQNEQTSSQAKYAVIPAPSPQAKGASHQYSPHPPISRVEEDGEDDDDDDDMFAVSKSTKKPRLENADDAASKAAYIPVINRTAGTAAATADAAGAPLIVDNFDDAEGYYRVILGEILDGDRYHLTAHLGKGMFSNVVRARDRHSPLPGSGEGEEAKYRDVAIKIMRSQESMYRAGQKEAIILRKLADADPSDKRHVIRLERTFEHRGHLCLVFESLSMNLRDVIKRFGKDVGINLKAVRAYAHQIFLALNLFSKLNLMHADIKPDNILVNESKSLLKVCDLGSASDTSEADITPYLVSRFYRAPEIILGLPYDCSLDMWSIGCTLYELYTGKILFPGRSNNHMLYLIQELKGRYPGRLVKKAKFGDVHFEDSNFVFVEKNKATGAESIKKMIIPPKTTSGLKNRLMPPAIIKKLPEDEAKLLSNFVNLLDRALELDPGKRLTPKEALNHPFLR